MHSAPYAFSRRARPPSGRITSDTDAQNVAAIWTISCTDENPGLIYASVASRLKIEAGQKVQKIVEDWRELFRPGVYDLSNGRDRSTAHDRFERLKTSCLQGLTPEESRESENNHLEDWCFRKKFRRNLDDLECTVEQIKFGLEYIETQRKSYLEFSEKERQDKIYRAPLWSIFLTLLVGLFALFLNYQIGREANKLKKVEIQIKNEELLLKKQESVKSSSAAAPTPALPAR